MARRAPPLMVHSLSNRSRILPSRFTKNHQMLDFGGGKKNPVFYSLTQISQKQTSASAPSWLLTLSSDLWVGLVITAKSHAPTTGSCRLLLNVGRHKTYQNETQPRALLILCQRKKKKETNNLTFRPTVAAVLSNFSSRGIHCTRR